MEANKQWKRVPFKIELAKKIQSGEIKGRIVTRNGGEVRILTLDSKVYFVKDKTEVITTKEKGINKPILVEYLDVNVTNGTCYQVVNLFEDGKYDSCGESDCDLFIEFPEEAPKQCCGDVYGDNRFEIIETAKKHILDETNIESRPEEMAVLDNILFRCWQMGWLKCYEQEVSKKETPKHEFKVGDKVNFLTTTGLPSEVARGIERYIGVIFTVKSICETGGLFLTSDVLNGTGLYFSTIECKNLEKISSKHELKPFDRVLVRNSKNWEWELDIFREKDGIMYVTMGGIYWNYCIPYEGNEHLIGTVNKPK